MYNNIIAGKAVNLLEYFMIDFVEHVNNNVACHNTQHNTCVASYVC